MCTHQGELWPWTVSAAKDRALRQNGWLFGLMSCGKEENRDDRYSRVRSKKTPVKSGSQSLTACESPGISLARSASACYSAAPHASRLCQKSIRQRAADVTAERLQRFHLTAFLSHLAATFPSVLCRATDDNIMVMMSKPVQQSCDITLHLIMGDSEKCGGFPCWMHNREFADRQQLEPTECVHRCCGSGRGT